MRSKTHNIFSFAISLLILRIWLYTAFLLAIFSSIFLSLSINWFIDHVAGHKGYRRAPYTHSFVTSILISILVAFLYTYILRTLGFALPIPLLYIASIAIAASHMFLDIMTKDGIYPLWPFSKVRISILGARYDNPALNAFIAIVSLTMIIFIVFDAIKTYLQ